MVKYVLGLLLLSCTVFAQTTLLDDISLQDLRRNAQLMNMDSAKYANQSFLIRSTSALQELKRFLAISLKSKVFHYVTPYRIIV